MNILILPQRMWVLLTHVDDFTSMKLLSTKDWKKETAKETSPKWTSFIYVFEATENDSGSFKQKGDTYRMIYDNDNIIIK